MSQVGGGAGLLSDVSMAATPLMAAGKRPGDPEVDDELYSYTYDVGRTGAENTPSGSSAERLYFDGRFSPVRKIRARDYAAKGGLMSLAEGGETAAPAAAEVAAPTASEAALAYLMGERSSSSAGLPSMAAQTQAASTQAPVVGSDNMYAFDPATGTFLRNPGVPGAESSGSPVGTSFAGGDGYQPVAPNPNFDTPEKQAAFYADPKNAGFGAFTRGVQKALSYTPMSLFARAVAPEYMAQRAAEQDRITRGDYSSGFAVGSDGRPASGYGVDSWSGNMDSYPGSDIDQGDRGEAAGGLITLAKGGMASGGFVVPADVVSALGNGSTDAGLRKLHAMTGNIKPIKGKGDGLSDSIPTNIDGKQPARVADGEAYIDPKTVKRLGGAKKLYAMMDKVRAQAHGKTTQQRPVNPGKVMA
jgi:hypothetical protein